MFSVRSSNKELLDQEEIPVADLFTNLKELDFINHWLGGYKISFDALRKVFRRDKEYVLVDIGCGGGDTLKRIARWNSKKRYSVSLYGIDLKEVCIDYSRKNAAGYPIHFICDDYRNVFKHVPKVNVVHACLFCHHLSDRQLVELVEFCLNNKAILVINDLERNWLAYYSIKLLTYCFSKSYLVKNDAPLSVLRGFKKIEWQEILNGAGARKYSVQNRWAFRHEVIVYPND